MARWDQMISALSGTTLFNGGGTEYVVQSVADSNVVYMIYIDSAADVSYKKTTNGGVSWSSSTVIFAGSATSLSVWYDRWSGIAAGLIHCAYTESGGSDTLYRSIDIEAADALGTQTTIFAGTSTAAGGGLSITRARGGNLYCWTMIDAGAEGGFRRSTDVGATWGARTINEALATQDQMRLLPGWAADNQDIMGIFLDASANELSRQVYDDSGDAWAESAIGAMTDIVIATSGPHYSATVDITNSQNVVAFWNAVDTANADLECFKVTESAITAVTNVVTNSTDDQGLAGICIDTTSGDWYCFYAGKSDGSETWSSSVNLYYKVSTDDGATWGAETQLTRTAYSIPCAVVMPRVASLASFMCFYQRVATANELTINVPIPDGGGGGLKLAGSGGLAG